MAKDQQGSNIPGAKPGDPNKGTPTDRGPQTDVPRAGQKGNAPQPEDPLNRGVTHRPNPKR